MVGRRSFFVFVVVVLDDRPGLCDVVTSPARVDDRQGQVEVLRVLVVPVSLPGPPVAGKLLDRPDGVPCARPAVGVFTAVVTG